MYFDLTDDQKAITDTIKSLLRNAIADDKAVEAFGAAALDRALFGQLMEMGLGGILVPEEQDGIGMDLLTLASVQEELGFAAAAVPVANGALTAWLLAVAGSDAQRARWLPGLMSGEVIAAFALEEDGAIEPSGWSVAADAMTGTKPNVLWGADASLFVVGTSDGGLALTEAGAPGVSVESVTPVDGSQPIAHVRFDGANGDPLTADGVIVTKLLDAIYILSAADACGAGNRAMDLAVSYAGERKQFERLIGSFQGMKHQLANMKAEMEPVRYLVWYAAHCWDAIPDEASRMASLAKAHASEVAVKVARMAVETHGGIGYTWEYPLHIYLKRAMTARATHGLPTRHRERSAALAGW